jgi:hypothetical protein
MSEQLVSIFYQFGVETMRRFAYTLRRVPAKRSVAASRWGVVLAEEMVNLPLSREVMNLTRPEGLWLVSMESRTVERIVI